MNANEMADKLSQYGEGAVFASIKLTNVAIMLRNQQALIDNLNGRIERMIEKQKLNAKFQN